MRNRFGFMSGRSRDIIRKYIKASAFIQYQDDLLHARVLITISMRFWKVQNKIRTPWPLQQNLDSRACTETHSMSPRPNWLNLYHLPSEIAHNQRNYAEGKKGEKKHLSFRDAIREFSFLCSFPLAQQYLLSIYFLANGGRKFYFHRRFSLISSPSHIQNCSAAIGGNK